MTSANTEVFVPTLGSAIREDLRRRHLGQADLAAHCNATQQAISLWINSNKVPNKRISSLVTYFGSDSKTALLLQQITNQETDRTFRKLSAKSAKHTESPISRSSANRSTAIQRAFLAKAEELVRNRKLDDARCVELLASWKDMF